MSTIKATVSMLETLPEDARLKVFYYTRDLLHSIRPANPYLPVGTDQVLSELEESRKQIEEGKGLSMKSALQEMGQKHGFI